MSGKKLLLGKGGEEAQDSPGTFDSRLPSELDPDSDSDWLSDTPSRTHSPFQEENQDRRFNRAGVGFSGAIGHILLGKGKVGGAGQRSAAGGDYKVYPWRWFMLVTLSLLNLSNGMVRTLDKIISRYIIILV